jgi:hypothetical protein
MADINEFTKAKSKTDTSHTSASRQTLNAPLNIPAGVKPPMDVKAVTSEKMRDLLARMKDVTHTWPIKLPDGTTGELKAMPAPFISNRFIIFAFPIDGHVVKNAVTSDGSQNFEVDGVLVITVTSDEKR